MRRTYDINTLHKFKYPNLMAEFCESGYSICTMSDHMGHGRCREDDEVIWGKLKGTIDINIREVVGLAKLFNTNVNYLFADNLDMRGGYPVAYYRHYESNKRQEEDARIFSLSQQVWNDLKEKPYLTELIEMILSIGEQQAQEVMGVLSGSGNIA